MDVVTLAAARADRFRTHRAMAPKPSGDTTGATDLAAVLDWLARYPKRKLELWEGDYYGSDDLTVAAAGQAILGQGCADDLGANAGTTWHVKKANGNGIVFNAAGGKVSDLHVLYDNGVPTAGAGLLFNDGDGARCHDFSVANFWNNVHIVGSAGNGASEMFLDKFFLYGHRAVGLRIENQVLPDGGDHAFSNFQIISNGGTPYAGVLWISGGGPKFTNFKINARSTQQQYGIAIEPGLNITESVFVIGDGSIENYANDGIRVVTASVGSSLRSIHMDNIQFGQYSNFIGRAIAVEGTYTTIQLVTIDNITGHQAGTSAATQPMVQLSKVNRVKAGTLLRSSDTAWTSRLAIDGTSTYVAADPPPGNRAMGVGDNTADITHTSSTMGQFGTISAQVRADPGDILDLNFVGTTYNNTASATNDFQFGVAGVSVGPIVRVKFPATANQVAPLAMDYTYTVQAGDIVSGKVTVTLRGLSSGTSTAYLANASGLYPVLRVRNVGMNVI